MKQIIIATTLLLSVISLSAQTTQNTDTLAMFLENNPDALTFNVIHEGSSLRISTDGLDLLICLSIANPALQMRLLMQQTIIYIDPSGRHRKNYSVHLPSAISVKDELDSLRPDDIEDQSPDIRPDIMPLIQALNKNGAVFRTNSKDYQLGYQRFYMEVDKEKELINIYVLLPMSELMQAKKLKDRWSIGLISNNDVNHHPSPGMEENRPPLMPVDDNKHQDDSENIHEILQSDIISWTKFSIDDARNINMK